MFETSGTHSHEAQNRLDQLMSRSKIAWWFCQGYYSSDTKNLTHFALSFFRVYEPGNTHTAKHHLFISLRSPDTKQQQVKGFVDQALLDSFQEQLSRRKSGFEGLAPFMADAILKEMSEYGPPGGFDLKGPPEIRQNKGWVISWDDFRLNWKDRTIEIDFNDFEQQQCRFFLSSREPLLDLAALGVPRMDNTTYFTFPRMQLSGTIGDQGITGEAWFDHQDADPTDWLLEQDGQDSRMLGWDWFAVNFDDGSDWIVIMHRDIKTNEPVDQYAVIQKSGHAPRLLRQFTAAPLDFWESPETHIRYPISWRLYFPEIDAEWRYDPLFQEQEIPIIGLTRAIWEGVGQVRGRQGDRPLQGRGQLELNGYGYIFDFNQYTRVFVEKINERLADFLPRRFDDTSLQRFAGRPVWRHDPEILNETLLNPVWDLLDRTSKHWRPILCFLFLEILGTPSKPYELLLSNIVELNHSGSLIIDDIEDDSLIRRGEECIHLRYGTDIAINTGTALYFLSYHLLESDLGLNDRQLVELYRIIVNFQIKAHLGQAKDIAWTNRLSPKWLSHRLNNTFSDQILQMYAMKTAAATQGAAEAACVIASADAQIREAFASFGRAFGVSFQLIDDVLNFSDSPDWTKTRGEDLAAGKPTWVIVRALELLNKPEREKLIHILCDPKLRTIPLKLQEGIELIVNSGALNAGRRLAGDMLEAEWRNFSQYVQPSEAKTMLRMLTTGLLSLEQDY